MIALVDYGAGNLRSVYNALRYAGATVQRVTRPEELGSANGVVLPGVGAFDDCLNAMERAGLVDACRQFIRSGRPFLGICVGYQALFERSEEFNSRAPGLGIFKGSVVRFNPSYGLKIPQIGWNQVEIVKPECPLFRGVPSGSYVYFVHSYFPVPEDSSVVAGWTTYGDKFASVVWHENVVATQFHPEKSQEIGLRMLRNFVEWAERA